MLGLKVGINVVFRDGDKLGEYDGPDVGVNVGDLVAGEDVAGLPVMATTLLGENDGVDEGLFEGLKDGDLVGFDVEGDDVGEDVGVLVGIFEVG